MGDIQLSNREHCSLGLLPKVLLDSPIENVDFATKRPLCVCDFEGPLVWLAFKGNSKENNQHFMGLLKNDTHPVALNLFGSALVLHRRFGNPRLESSDCPAEDFPKARLSSLQEARKSAPKPLVSRNG